MADSPKLPPAIETGLRAGVSEIQRRNRERNFVRIAYNGDRTPVMTTEEMLKILREFVEAEIAAPRAPGPCGKHPKACWVETDPAEGVSPHCRICVLENHVKELNASLETVCEHERLAVAAARQEDAAIARAQGAVMAAVDIEDSIPPADRSALDAYVQEEVAEAVLKLGDELNQCLQIIVTNAGDIKTSRSTGPMKRDAANIEDAVKRAADSIRAAANGHPSGESK